MRVDLLVPSGFADRPSGGNVYDRHLVDGLTRLGWEVVTHQVVSAAQVEAAVAALPAGSRLLVDSLVASWSAGALLAAPERVVMVLHMLFGTSGERDLLTEVRGVVVTSEWARRQLLTSVAVDPRRVRVAVPGAERAVPVAGTAAGASLLCVGAVVRAKGHDVLIAALARLAELDWRCTVAGALELEPDFVDELAKAAADAGIADRLDFTGALTTAQVATAYAEADLLVLPSRAETYGMVVTEALARGVPVVASSVGGVPEALGFDDRGNHPGMLVRPDDPAALARSLRRWLEDARLRTWLRRTARSRRATLPTWSQAAGQVALALAEAR